jgi:sialate O-acetylesterase
MRLKLLASAALLFAFTINTQADVRLPSVIGSHMVLQQGIEAPIWGWAEPGEKVTVSMDGLRVETVADEEGRWQVEIGPYSLGEPQEMLIQGENEIRLTDILIGEVWLCAGQSNMGWRLTFTFEGIEDSAAADHPNFRIFRSERCHSSEPQDDCVAQWTRCDPESAGTCSAVSFYFAQKLHLELGVPVGILVQPYAGTPIEGWMPRDIQLNDPRTLAIIEETDAMSADYDLEAAERQYERSMEAWKNGERGAEPKLRQPANAGHQYPGNIFNGLIHPVRPFGIRGAIWYQGERNAKDLAQAANYVNQLPMLIDYYRSSWHEMSDGNVADDFPFYFVQLPCWHPAQTEPVEPDAAWAVSREMMRLVAADVPNTGAAVSIDTGDEILLHPKDKKPIGLRLAYLALKQTYGLDFVESGPLYKSHKIESDKIILTFDCTGSGLMSSRDGPLNAFAIAGADQQFVWADAVIEGDSIVVSAEAVPHPVAVRYAWAMNPSQRNLLYNREGLPASPFRTDAWPLFDPETYDPEEQFKPEKPEGYEPIPLVRPPMTQ